MSKAHAAPLDKGQVSAGVMNLGQIDQMAIIDVHDGNEDT